jgi:propanol-preferring alcohol dehydrogenase
MLCAGITMYAALRKSNARGGDWIVISGAGGGLGHIGVQIAARGLGLRVIGIDHWSKEHVVMDSGAASFINTTERDSASITAEVKRLTNNLGSHAAIVCTSSNEAYAQSLSFLRFGGTLVCVGVPEGASVPIGSAKPSHLILSQLNITAVSVGNKKDAQAVLEMAARGVVKVKHALEPLENLTNVSDNNPIRRKYTSTATDH